MSAVAVSATSLDSPHAHGLSGVASELQSLLGADAISVKEIDRLAIAHDASHYLLVPGGVLRPRSADDMGAIFASASRHRVPLTFRSGGTSLSGQAVSDGLMLDTRRNFRDIEVLDSGRRVRVQPGATVMAVNNMLAPYGYRLGPDPASLSACTIGGVVANNSSGMSSGTEFNTYNTLESLVFVLPSGTVIDTADADADAQLRAQEPDIHEGLLRLRRRILANPASVATIKQQFSMKNTMGYGLNSFLDFETPVEILEHLLVGSEGTLAFVASATYRTLPILTNVSTGLLVFDDLITAAKMVPTLVENKLSTAELLDATSIRVAQRTGQAAAALAAIDVKDHASVLVEFQGNSAEELRTLEDAAAPMFASLPVVAPVEMTTDLSERNKLWQARRGLYTTVAGNRPSGTNALLEDVVVPVDVLGETCQELGTLFDVHGYEDSVIFGHAKDGNVHFMLNEKFDDADKLRRYEAFTEDMVDLIVGRQGSLKAEHGTGRIMAPYIERQFGTELYEVMVEVKRLIDPTALLNPGVIITDNPRTYIENLKVAPAVEQEVDRCVECGYCEPVCPSKDLTLTPRQRIVMRREVQTAEEHNPDLANRLRKDYEYYGMETCAVDGMCFTRCPVLIDTGDLVRRLRSENQNKLVATGWTIAAKNWGAVDAGAGVALDIAKKLPFPAVKAVTDFGRKVMGEDLVPQYKKSLSAGGKHRVAHPDVRAEIVFFPACVNAMFGGVDGDGKAEPMNATAAFEQLCERAGVRYTVPEGISSLCCGTPWKSKGYTDGYLLMSDKVLSTLWKATRGGELPVVCDASSCTEGLEVMKSKVTAAAESQLKNGVRAGEADFAKIRFIDAVQFTAERLLPGLTVTRPLDSVVLHPTCSVTHLGVQAQFVALAQAISPDAVVPANWGCCGYAGDRGMLHPELTASATKAEAREVNERSYSAYVSTNRTCEQGMTEATGHTYQNILQLVEKATR
ncbi:FAD-binding and (Fe-S)-binding domain-containing protein [Rothia sp. ZJ1223]|uniref:FAD-binding and (Fe-S)-binding domain-containing protein n=1 Tax=Rothia sp. ZJ1223 TaxID=2811098 RepID=UPI00195730BC|nr:FAD-binding and (Fe-S)-binding domain-containing protein [Rothia sp. ZJ1223]MBM7051986.1 FAD-binding oxidoreductase [Rothia sp. ZJ1223]